MKKCLICEKDFKSTRALHCHLKAHSGTQAYYQQFFPRFDCMSYIVKCESGNNFPRITLPNVFSTDFKEGRRFESGPIPPTS